MFLYNDVQYIKMFYFVIIDDRLYSCGENNYGQLGLGDQDARETLTLVTTSNHRFISVSNSDDHTMALDIDGYLWACGSNYHGKLGLNDQQNRLVLTKVSTTQTFKAVSCGENHTAAIDTDGFLWVCGNSYLSLDTMTLTKVSNQKFVTVSCSGNHTMVIDEDGFLWGFGGNPFFCLGIKDNISVNVLTKVSEQKFKMVSCGYSHTVAIDIDGYLWSCGRNDNFQLCYNSNELPIPLLSKVPNLEHKFLAVSCCFLTTMVIEETGSVWCCGFNGDGKFGLGEKKFSVGFTVNNFFDLPIVSLGVTKRHSLVVDTNRSLWICDYNSSDHRYRKVITDGPIDKLFNYTTKPKGFQTKGAHNK